MSIKAWERSLSRGLSSLSVCKDLLSIGSQMDGRLKEIEESLIDIEHELELADNLTRNDYYKWGVRLRKLRRERREIKNLKEIYHPFLHLIKGHEKVFSDCKKVVNEVEKIRCNVGERKYSPRRLTDLTIEGEHK